MSSPQEIGHPSGHDYEAGSPHLKHSHLRSRVSDSLRLAVKGVLTTRARCRVLEVGAGHGTFTDVIVGAGAEVVVTEMSSHSARILEDRYSFNPNITVIHDHDGKWIDRTDEKFDLIACLSVLHHIPDYMSFLASAFARIRESGKFLSWQDPMWYPKQSAWNRNLERGAYSAWRLSRGNLRQGLSTRLRRVRGVYDESNPADMVEYHVVRNGVNQDDIMSLGREYFNHVELITYWSTQGRAFQSLGEQFALTTTFGLMFDDRVPPVDDGSQFRMSV